jgi:hypothetical protein
VDVGQIIQDLHDAGIAGGIVWQPGGSFGASLGDPPIATVSAQPSVTAAVLWLCAEAGTQYPNSTFAAKYRQ